MKITIVSLVDKETHLHTKSHVANTPGVIQMFSNRRVVLEWSLNNGMGDVDKHNR
jgi:hypothetical protein